MGNPAVRFQTFQLGGGLDLISPSMSLKPGVATAALNWEINVGGGYARVAGYERVDGTLPNPSAANFAKFTLTTAAAITVGGAVSNGTGATGTVIAIDGLDVFYTQQVGSFAVADVVNAGPTITAVGGVVDAATTASYNLLASNVYRALILAVPGSGSVRGVAFYNEALYAWRDNAGATLLEMHKATSAGWVKVAFGYEVAFSAGSLAPSVGAVITQGAVSATVRVVALETGSWGAGTAAGRFITDAPSAGAFVAGALTAGGTANLIAGLAGALVQAPITFAPGGRMQTNLGNMGGGTKLYGCDNTNRGFEFDGTTMVPIQTGMAVDTPTNVLVLKNYLRFSFGASLQFSAIGDPYSWSPLLGAGEIALDDDITAMVAAPGNQTSGASIVYSANRTYILYGNSFGTGGDASLVSFETGMGAEKYTSKNMEQPYALASRGVVGLRAVQEFGNFSANTLTLNVRPYIAAHRGTAVASGLNHEKSQYRVFYASGDALYLTIDNGVYKGAMPVTFAHNVTCWCEGSGDDETEGGYFGSDDGFVRKMDIGTSFDGEVIPHQLQLNYDSIGSPRVLKRYRKAALEVTGPTPITLNVGYSLAYGDYTAKDQPDYATATTRFSNAVQWDAFTWDAFTWDGITLGMVEVELSGSGENLSMRIQGSTATDAPYSINTMTIHYSPRRNLR